MEQGMGDMKIGVIERFKEYLPVTEHTPTLTLGEGDTPLVKSHHIGKKIGCDDLYFKFEGTNPTGSFKDRGMVLAVAKAIEEGSTSLACASTGNTSASAAAYAAYCGLRLTVLVPKGNVASGKLAQATAFGARILLVNGNFDCAMNIVSSLTQRHPIVLLNSINPYRIQGQKTAAFEIVEEMGSVPDHVFIPVGNAGNITAYWLGFTELLRIGSIVTRPKMMGFQAEGAAPIVRGHQVVDPETEASAIKVGNPVSWKGAVQARDESGGIIGMVSDQDIVEAYKMLAMEEGIFCETASAASVAGLLKLSRESLELNGKKVVCVITGTGLKDLEQSTRLIPGSMEECAPDLTAVEKAMDLN